VVVLATPKAGYTKLSMLSGYTAVIPPPPPPPDPEPQPVVYPVSAVVTMNDGTRWETTDFTKL